MGDFFVILVSAILVNNFVLARFLGLCPFMGVTKKVDTAVGMGASRQAFSVSLRIDSDKDGARADTVECEVAFGVGMRAKVTGLAVAETGASDVCLSNRVALHVHNST